VARMSKQSCSTSRRAHSCMCQRTTAIRCPAPSSASPAHPGFSPALHMVPKKLGCAPIKCCVLETKWFWHW
jgi:hypothetical protein